MRRFVQSMVLVSACLWPMAAAWAQPAELLPDRAGPEFAAALQTAQDEIDALSESLADADVSPAADGKDKPDAAKKTDDKKSGDKSNKKDKPETIESLAKRLAAVEKDLEKQQAAEKKQKDTAAKRFVVRPFGRLHVDAGTFTQDADNKAVVGNARNGVDIRRARLGVEGEGFDTFFYRFDVDFVTFDQQTASRPTIFDAYIDMQNLPALGNLRAGHFREPFSLERLDSTHDLPFIERSAGVNALAPFRNLGLMAFDWNGAETVTWSYGVFDESTNEFGEANRDRAGVAATGRVTWLPWYDDLAEGRYLLHLGASYSYRRVSNQQRRFNQSPEVVLKEGLSLRTPNFVDTGVINLPDYHLAGLEASAVLGPWSMQGEYLFAAGHETGAGTLYFQGGYGQVSYFLTGENRNYNRRLGIYQAVTPYSNVFRVCTDEGIVTSWGAWEAVGRVSNLDLASGNIAGGNMTNLTVGMNWYFAVRTRCMFNYIHSFLDRGNRDSNADIFLCRLQYAF